MSVSSEFAKQLGLSHLPAAKFTLEFIESHLCSPQDLREILKELLDRPDSITPVDAMLTFVAFKPEGEEMNDTLLEMFLLTFVRSDKVTRGMIHRVIDKALTLRPLWHEMYTEYMKKFKV